MRSKAVRTASVGNSFKTFGSKAERHKRCLENFFHNRQTLSVDMGLWEDQNRNRNSKDTGSAGIMDGALLLQFLGWVLGV